MKDRIVHIYADQFSIRLQYIAYVLFDQLLGVDFQIITDTCSYTDSPFPKINYSNRRLLHAEIRIPSRGLLYQSDIAPLSVNSGRAHGLPYLFADDSSGTTFPFDFFSMAFFLLTRYEEYLPFSADPHGRFPAAASVATRHEFIHLPIIELWLERLRILLQQKFPHQDFTPARFCFLPTYDIDIAWAYLERPWWRTVGSIVQYVRGGRWRLLRQQMSVLCGHTSDPYDVFGLLDQLHRQQDIHPIYFFLLANYASYDKNIAPDNQTLQSLIRTTHKQYQIGIHPSYESNLFPEKLQVEIGRLASLSGESVRHSRQHFLKLHLPDTYQYLLKQGITHDYSMGYAEQIGFRAGISRAYRWYDLSKECMTLLTVQPFCVMDVTLRQYLEYSPDVALEALRPMVAQLQAVGGTFCTLWHNSSFSEAHGWAGWAAVYQQLVKWATKN